MAALTADLETQEKAGQVLAYPVGASKKIFAGSFVVVDITTGYAEAGTDAANKNFVGIAYESADNTGGAAGALTVKVKKTGAFIMTAVSGAQTSIGKPLLLVDDNTCQTAATTNNIGVGQCVEFISSTKLRVRIDGAAK